MNNTIVALQGLYVVLGGQLTDTYADIANGVPVSDYTIIPDIIMAISKKATSGGGGASLPAVTTDDNSKLLTVVNGTWDKANAPKELPEVSGFDDGSVLAAMNDEWVAMNQFANVIDGSIGTLDNKKLLQWDGINRLVVANIGLQFFDIEADYDPDNNTWSSLSSDLTPADVLGMSMDTVGEPTPIVFMARVITSVDGSTNGIFFAPVIILNAKVSILGTPIVGEDTTWSIASN